MNYIFFDESGDLGFNEDKKNSKYFVVSFLFVKKTQKRSLEKIISKIFRKFSKKEVKISGGVLHAVKEKPQTRKKVLSEMAKKDISLFFITLNKQKVYANLQDEKHVLYNYVVNILLNRLFDKNLLPQEERQINF